MIQSLSMYLVLTTNSKTSFTTCSRQATFATLELNLYHATSRLDPSLSNMPDPSWPFEEFNGQTIRWTHKNPIRPRKWKKALARMKVLATNQDFSEYTCFKIIEYFHKSPSDRRIHLTVQLQTREREANNTYLVTHVYKVDDKSYEEVSYKKFSKVCHY
ncbi:hypothetical protein BDV95DRAFT_593442 [Massariosphaeria phaeospora]|uniref:Uncharacterized protein n=1 Tax=Massariosphaeria phaeospora TaxID=100035 RepID=A0A7C8MMV1_9PLEO|nr:hypothetical protein BDV95DRAFT_593442 [Massariosphaeria phaeospora]